MLLLVRHSAPQVEPAVPAEEWHLSAEGRRRCVPLGARLARHQPRSLLASTEPKAWETAELLATELGLEVRHSDALRETARKTVPWLARDELESRIRALFRRPDEIVFGEESAASALARFSDAVEALERPAVVVSHGTVISLYVAAQTGEDPYEIWRRLELPDVVELG